MPSPAPDPPLNATAASLLGFLHEGPLTGWDLVATAQRRIAGFWSLTRSQVYRELAAMAATGLVEAGPPGPRERRPYAITPRGRAAFGRWLDQDPAEETIRFPLLLSIGFGRHLPAARLEAIVARHREIHAERLARYEHAHTQMREGGAPPDPYRLATLEFGLAYERAALSWFAALPKAIRGDQSVRGPS